MEEGRGREGRQARKRAAELPADPPKASRRRRADGAEGASCSASGSGSGSGSGAHGGSNSSSSRRAEEPEQAESKRTRSILSSQLSTETEESGGSRSSRAKEAGAAKESKKDAGKEQAGELTRGRSRRAEKQSGSSSAASRAPLTSSVDVSPSFLAGEGAGAALAGDPLSGLRRLLGPGFDELPMGSSIIRGPTNKFRMLLEGLKADGDLAKQIESLTELCDILCMATEETLLGFSVEGFLPPLIQLVSSEASADVMLLACRALAYILDAIPGSSAAVVHYGSIPPLCEKLMAIEYIDVAEQAVLTLHKISQDHAGPLLRANGISAVLSYLDFFPISVQRTGMATVANMCKRVTADCISFVADSIQQLSNLLLHSDSKLVEHVCNAFCRLVTSLEVSKDGLEQVARHSLIPNTWRLVSSSITDSSMGSEKNSELVKFGTDMCAQLLQMLATLASASPTLGITLLKEKDIGLVLRNKVLGDKSLDSSMDGGSRRRASQEHSNRTPPQLLRSFMAVANALLPPMPTLPPSDKEEKSPSKSTPSGKKGGARNRNGGKASSTSEAEEAGVTHWKENETLMEDFGEQLLEVVLSMANQSIDMSIRLDSLTACCKLCHYIKSQKLETLLCKSQVCELISALLVSDSLQCRFLSLVLIHELMSKSPTIFSPLFVREGIVHSLSKTSPKKAPAAAPKREERPSLTCFADRAAASLRMQPQVQEITEAIFSTMLQYVCDKHMPSDSASGAEGLTPVVKDLRQLGSLMVKAAESGDEESAEGNMRKIINLFNQSETVSTFEMQKSDVCQNLLRFLSQKKESGKSGGRKTSAKNANAQVLLPVLERRWDSFVSAVTKQCEDEGETTSPSQILILKLVAALNNSEGFDISAQHHSATESESQLAKQSRMIFQPLRLRFQRGSAGASTLKEYSNAVVIDPLASISAIHDFLWPRVRRSNKVASSSASSSSAEAAGATSTRSTRTGSSSRSQKSSVEGSSSSTTGRAVAAGGSASRSRGGGTPPGEGESTTRRSRAVYVASTLAGASAGMESEDEELSDGEGDLAMDEEMVTLSRSMDAGEQGDEDDAFDNGEMEDDMDFDGDDVGDEEMGHRVQVMDIQLAPNTSTAPLLQTSHRQSQQSSGSNRHDRDSASSSRSAPRSSQPDGDRLRLSIGGQVLSNSSTSIIEAVLLSFSATQAGSSTSSASSSLDSRAAIWTTIHTIEYEPANARDSKQSDKDSSEKPGLSIFPSAGSAKPSLAPRGLSLLTSSEFASLDSLGLPHTTVAMLRLISVLQTLNSNLPLDLPSRVSQQELVVGNLSRKASAIIRDPLQLWVHKVPQWIKVLLSSFPYLLAHNVRRMYFDLQAFGLLRALKNSGRNSTDGRDRQQSAGGGVQRRKVRVGRARLIESAKKVMEMYCSESIPPTHTLEVEFSGEVGVGAGPSQEFFSSFCRELQRRELSLWWDSEGKTQSSDPIDDVQHVRCSHGLFPAPLNAGATEARNKRLETFEVMGWMCGKAILDGRLLDLPLSAPFCRALTGSPLEISDLRFIVPQVYDTVKRLQEVVSEKRQIQQDSKLSDAQKKVAISSLTLDGAKIEDLCLSFTVPVYDIPLRKGGEDEVVTAENVDEYLDLLPNFVLVDSVAPILESFRSGFDKVLPIDSLRLFCVEELLELFGSDESVLDWTPDMLLQVFKFEHGYTSSSKTPRLLVDVLASLPPPIKRKFVSFCTGCPRLPIGGLSALRPPLTVVKRESSRAPTDQTLPSVMTCANYLKLPEYDSGDVLKDRLLVAVQEADGSFHLS